MTAINSNRAIRGPVTAVPVVAGKGVRLVADTENNRWVVEADETVLYDKIDAQGATLSSPAISLSESIFNFERIKIYWKNWNSGYSRIVNEFDRPSDNVFFNCMGAFYTSNAAVIFVLNINKNANGTALNFDKGTFCTFGNTTVNNASNTIIYRVVGVNRIASN